MPPIKPSAELVSRVLGAGYVEIEDQEKIHEQAVKKAETILEECEVGDSGTTQIIDGLNTTLPIGGVVSYRLVRDEEGDITLMTGGRPAGSRKKAAEEECSAIFLTEGTSYEVPGTQMGGGPGVVSPIDERESNHRFEKYGTALHPNSEQFIDVNDTLNLMARKAVESGLVTVEDLIESEAFTPEDLAFDPAKAAGATALSQ